MKATIDIPEMLYRQIKAKSALEGRPVRDVVICLFQEWLGRADNERVAASAEEGAGPTPAWFGAARRYAKRVRRHDLAAVRRSIARGRGGQGRAGTSGEGSA
ncbi:MAG: hypothetical protein JXR37_32295 [Kiritimatiellae bacterium]|nr:hypothetical protein [Kiritimatiellia bacterium]